MIYANMKKVVRLAGVVMMLAPLVTHAQTTTRVSVDDLGVEGNLPSGSSSISADGRFVAFNSLATNLVVGDTNNTWDVFVHDRQTGVTQLVSVDSAGGQANDISASPSISADGRFVSFISNATNLVAGDTNNAADIFVHDRQTGVTQRVSVDSLGGEANDLSDTHSISADGRLVAFETLATNLVTGDSNGGFDIFVHDRQTGVTTRVSVDSKGIEANDSSINPAISADGRFVVFRSDATNLVAGDTNNVRDVFVHDRQTGAMTRVNVDSLGNESVDLGFSTFDVPSISADGRFVTFASKASNLVGGDTNDWEDVFVHDLQTGATTRVSVNSEGVEANAWSLNSSISADGR